MTAIARVEGGAQPKMKIGNKAIPESVPTTATVILCLAVTAEVMVDVLSVKAFTVLAVAAALGLIRMVSSNHATRVEAAVNDHASRMETSAQNLQEGLASTVLEGERANERAMRGATRAFIDATGGYGAREFNVDTGPFPIAGRGN